MFEKLLQIDKPLALMLIRAQKEVFSSMVGNHVARGKGEGYDFTELRPYETGDDIKHIDWIISSKLAQPHVKVFHQQRELNVSMVMMLSASVRFGTTRLKQDVMAEITALIALSCLKQGDSYEAYFANDKVSRMGQKNKQLFGVRNLVEQIVNYDVLGKTLDYRKIIMELYNNLRQKSLLFLVGDFFNTQGLDLRVLSLKHEVIVVIVRDRFEEHPPAVGNLDIIDPSSGKSAEIKLNEQALKSYQKKLFIEEEAFLKRLKKSAVKFVKVYTDENPAQKILSLMVRR